MTTLRTVLLIGVFFAYCLAELLLALQEHRRRIPVRKTVWRSAALLFLFTTAVSVLAGLRVRLATGLGLLVGGLFPLQIAWMIRRRAPGQPPPTS